MTTNDVIFIVNHWPTEAKKKTTKEEKVGYKNKRKVDSAFYPLWDCKMSISFGDGACIFIAA